MSQLHNSILGTPSGKVGNLVFRRRRGKVFIYTTSIPVDRPFSEAETANQNKFVFLRRAAACIDQEYFLKGLWNNCTLPGGIGFERHMKSNAPLYNNLDISKLKLVPVEEPIPAGLMESLLEEKVLRVVTGPISAGYARAKDLKISAHGMMLISGEAANHLPYLFIPLTSEEDSFLDGSAYTFHMPVKSDQFDLYSERSFAVCLIIKDENGAPLKYSVNLAAEV